MLDIILTSCESVDSNTLLCNLAVLYPPPRSLSGLRGLSEDSPNSPRTVQTARGQSEQSEDSPNSPRTVRTVRGQSEQLEDSPSSPSQTLFSILLGLCSDCARTVLGFASLICLFSPCCYFGVYIVMLYTNLMHFSSYVMQYLVITDDCDVIYS